MNVFENKDLHSSLYTVAFGEETFSLVLLTAQAAIRNMIIRSDLTDFIDDKSYEN